MDKLDESIKDAKNVIEPSTDFVERTMDKINVGQPIKKHWSFKLWGSALAGAIAIVAIVFIVLPLTTKTAKDSSNSSTKTRTTTPSQSNANTPLAVGTDNTSLSNDLTSIQSSIGQENNDQNSANSGLNDAQQEIAVPTD